MTLFNCCFQCVNTQCDYSISETLHTDQQTEKKALCFGLTLLAQPKAAVY